MTSDRTALLFIRAWVEHGSVKPLRAEVRHTDDVSEGLKSSSTLTETDAVTDVVRAWLETVLTEVRGDADAPALP